MNMQRYLWRFLRSTQGGATALAAVAVTVTVMTVGAAALIGDHLWLVDQRDTLKTAADSAGVAATLGMARLVGRNPGISDSELEEKLQKVAKRYVEINLSHLPTDRLAQARSTLVVEVGPNRSQRTVDVSAEADLGGTLLAKHMPLFNKLTEPPWIRVRAVVERIVNPIEVVLAIDISQSMERCLSGYGRRCGNPDEMRISIVKRAAANLVDILDPNADNEVAVGMVPWHMVVRLDDSAIDEWTRKGWAEYPLSRHYSSTYSCGNRECPAPAADQNLPAVPPEEWLGCLDEHRVPGVGAHASLPADGGRFASPANKPFAQAFFPAPFGTAYECVAYPGPTGFALQFCYPTFRYESPSWAQRRAQKVQAAQYGCGDTHPVILPLTSDRTRIDAAIDRLEAVGHLTYSALGVLWGQRLLEHHRIKT